MWDIRGTTGDTIGDELSFRIQGGDGANNQGCPHVITPVSPAAPVFSYVDLSSAPALGQVPTESDSEDIFPEGPYTVYEDDRDSAPNLPGAPIGPVAGSGEAGSEVGLLSHIRSGTAALRVDTGTYKVVYFGFGFEAIDSREMRQEVMKRVLSWLAHGTIQGAVDLQWRSGNSGARVSIVGTNMSTLTRADGSFVLFGIPAGDYYVEVTLPTYLTAKRSNVSLLQGEVTALPPLVLYGGDLNMDGRVDLLDLTFLMLNYYMTDSAWN